MLPHIIAYSDVAARLDIRRAPAGTLGLAVSTAAVAAPSKLNENEAADEKYGQADSGGHVFALCDALIQRKPEGTDAGDGGYGIEVAHLAGV